MEKIIFSEQDIKSTCSLIGGQLSTRYRFDKYPPVVVGILKSSASFYADLVANIDIPIMTDFIQYSSYTTTESSSTVTIKKDLSVDVKDRAVILVVDIVDTGLTISYIYDYILKSYQPSEVVTVCLIDKKSCRKVSFDVDYVGKEVDEGFLLGYGLSYKDVILPSKSIFVLDDEVKNSLNQTK